MGIGHYDYTYIIAEQRENDNDNLHSHKANWKDMGNNGTNYTNQEVKILQILAFQWEMGAESCVEGEKAV
ncbi:hypothetical protein [Flavonifractor sp. An100]|uniref:hypothetical protein n=1 Tax=Flavonifractor sp. An100 TaxID=1965538 RepID=UPI0013024E73|nr:hypothetical protein [Flavonifractor sp. An100]